MLFGLAVLGGTLLAGGGIYHHAIKPMNKSIDESNAEYVTYKNFYNAMEENGLTDYDVKQYIDELYETGYFSYEEWKDYVKLLDKAEKQWKDGKGWNDIAYSFRNAEDHKKMSTLYNTLYARIPLIKDSVNKAFDMAPEEVKNSFYSAIPAIQDAPAPNYMDPNFKGERIDVDPVHLYTGQEMADLHDINYDPNYYYDLIKQGTEANKNLGEYQSDQLRNAAMVEDTKNQVDYLDAIRNTKAEAIANGSTAGGRAAAELLNNKEAIQNYADNLANVAQQRYNAVDSYLLADAQAKLNARDYFNQLAQSLSTDSMSLYASDTERQGGQYKADSNMVTADADLRGAIHSANGAMAGSYAQAQASVNAARTSANGPADELAWLYDRFLGANRGNIRQTNIDMNQYIRGNLMGPGNYSYTDNYLKTIKK